MDTLHNFLKGIGASNELLHRAVENKSFIEVTCLAATQIDALLRFAILLDNQLKNNNKDLIEEYLFQGTGDKVLFEKKVYDLVHERNIIDKIMYERLYKIYNERNKVVHRYIISDITTEQVMRIAKEILIALNYIKEIVRSIEDQQVKTGRGMTTEDKLMNQDEIQKFINKDVADKHGNINLDIPPANGKKGNDRTYQI